MRLSGARFVLAPSASRIRGTLLLWSAWTSAIWTPRSCPKSLTVRLPPSWTLPTQGDERGTVTSRPRPVAGQAGVSAPRMFWIFRARNAPMSLLTMTAEFLEAAISAVLELGAADTVAG